MFLLLPSNLALSALLAVDDLVKAVAERIDVDLADPLSHGNAETCRN